MYKNIPVRTHNMASFLSRFTSQRSTWVPIAVGSVAVAASLYYTNATKAPVANDTPTTFKGDDQWIDLKVSIPYEINSMDSDQGKDASNSQCPFDPI